jgi:protein-S-isoprenylcysteine O-methyltransferase Ste14
MLIRWVRAILLLPGTVLIVVPLTLLRLTRGPRWIEVPGGAPDPWFWAGAAAGIGGVFWSGWSVVTFMRHGEGTAAPWDPPRRFVATGPFRHVRNPMILGVFLMLLCEAVVFRSWAVAGWMTLFVTGNLFYIPLSEEPGLEKRFGVDYMEYRQHVRRWIPRPAGWPRAGRQAADRREGVNR